MKHVLIIAGISAAGLAFADDTVKGTVLSGVYSAAQAKRGEDAYMMRCARCHGEDLTGRAMGPLKGDKFLDRWREDSLGLLFDHIRTRMPGNEPGSLSENTYLDILAYILQQNAIPAGEKDLTADAVSGWILVGKDGPKPLSTNTQVQATGCLTQESGGAWMLVDATEPVRTRTPEQITGEELKSASAKAAGSQKFRLQNLDDVQPSIVPENVRNRKVLVKGVLVRHANQDHINVMRLEATAEACSR